jgi:hypothetical protein
MPSRRKHWDEYEVCVEWQAKVCNAALTFEARWTEAALRRIDPALHARFLRQRELFNDASENGTIDDVVEQGAAMVRGYVAVVATMEAAGGPDEAYQIGRGPGGLAVGIGPKPCCARLRELYGDVVVWLSPDEVAAIIELDARFKKIVDVKRAFPGAEMKG